jgi:hypothetical protein
MAIDSVRLTRKLSKGRAGEPDRRGERYNFRQPAGPPLHCYPLGLHRRLASSVLAKITPPAFYVTFWYTRNRLFSVSRSRYLRFGGGRYAAKPPSRQAAKRAA